MEKAIERRVRERERALERARIVAECVASKLGRVVAVVFGSYARGDFNEWSDIDLLVVCERSLPRSPLERLDAVEECLALGPGVELVLMSIDELRRHAARRNPLVIEALERGIEVLNTLGEPLSELVRSEDGGGDSASA